MLCSPCKYAADTGDQDAHKMCPGCGCQHHRVGYGRPEPKLPAAETPEPETPAVTEMDEARREALASTGLTIEELESKAASWSLDGWELKVWNLLKEAA